MLSHISSKTYREKKEVLIKIRGLVFEKVAVVVF